MTRFIFISIFFLAMISMTSYTASGRGNKSSIVKTHGNKRVKPRENSTSFPVSKSVPKLPAAKTVPHEPVEEKNHSSKTEEVPHIHHFHKGRVKKAKRHHKKYWALSMLLVVLCHAALLLMAYMHAAS